MKQSQPAWERQCSPPDHKLLLIIHLHCTLVSQVLFDTLGHRLIQRFPEAEEGDTWHYKKLSTPASNPRMCLLIHGAGMVFTQILTPKVQTSGKQTWELQQLLFQRLSPGIFTVLYLPKLISVSFCWTYLIPLLSAFPHQAPGKQLL